PPDGVGHGLPGAQGHRPAGLEVGLAEQPHDVPGVVAGVRRRGDLLGPVGLPIGEVHAAGCPHGLGGGLEALDGLDPGDGEPAVGDRVGGDGGDVVAAHHRGALAGGLVGDEPVVGVQQVVAAGDRVGDAPAAQLVDVVGLGGGGDLGGVAEDELPVAVEVDGQVAGLGHVVVDDLEPVGAGLVGDGGG